MITGKHFSSFIFLFALFFCAVSAASQTLTSYPYDGVLQPRPGYTVSVDFFLDLDNDIDLPGTGNYTWTISSTTGVSGFSASTITEKQTITFLPVALGKYIFTISRGGTTIEDSIVVCNLLSCITKGGSGEFIAGYVVNNGTLSNEAPFENIFFTNALETSTGEPVRSPAIGVNEAGYMYYIPSLINQGLFYIVGASPNGSNFAILGSFDINGDDTSNVGFVRLGIDASGVGWVLAADNTGEKIYLSKFVTNGMSPVSFTLVSSNIPFGGAYGSAKDFQNGDLAIDGDGMMLVLANNSSSLTQTSNTVIYSLNTKSPAPVLQRKFYVNNNNNQPFTAAVTGVAFDPTGNVYFSCVGEGLFFIPKSTIDTVAETVKGSLLLAGQGLIDLATNYWPVSSIIPVKFGDLSAKQNNEQVLLKWTTYMEENLHHFEIEKSYSGGTFVSIGTQKAKGNTTGISLYEFNDQLKTNDPFFLYRLKMTDLDGNYTYSPVIRLNNIAASNIAVYPNPFNTDLSLQVQSFKNTSGALMITDISGRVICKKTVRLINGINKIMLSSELKNMKAGVYNLLLITMDGNIFQKQVIRR